MPAALQIDREQVQMLALTYGVREAARRMGLPEGTVLDWSSKGKWVVDRPASVPLPPTMVQSVQSISPVKVLAQSMREDAMTGRAAQLRLGRKTLESLADKPVDELLTLEMSIVAKNYGSLHAQAAGYSSSDTLVKVNLGITSDRSTEIPAIQEAEWTEGTEDKGITDTF